MGRMRYPTKYGNRKTIIDNITFDSKHEAERYIELRFMKDKGMIHNLELQKKYVLIPAQYEQTGEVYTKGKHKGEPKQGKLIERELSYYADFDYYTADGEHIVEDAKGMKTKDYIIKRKLMLYLHGIKIREV